MLSLRRCLSHKRACAQGHSVTATVLLTPLFFGLAHLHHLREHVVHQGHTLQLAATMVRRRRSAPLVVHVWEVLQPDIQAIARPLR